MDRKTLLCGYRCFNYASRSVKVGAAIVALKKFQPERGIGTFQISMYSSSKVIPVSILNLGKIHFGHSGKSNAALVILHITLAEAKLQYLMSNIYPQLSWPGIL